MSIFNDKQTDRLLGKFIEHLGDANPHTGSASTSGLSAHTSDSTIHFTEASIDHTAIGNIGTNSHSQIDTHIADSTTHFTEGSIDHTAITNIGTNTHAQIDTHIADSTKHFTEGSIDHTAISNIGTTSHADIDTAVTNSTNHIAAANPHSGSASSSDLSTHTSAANPHSGSAPDDHAATHIDGGTYPIDGDKIEITWSDYSNYTPDTSPSETDASDQLTAHLNGIDILLGQIDSVGGKLEYVSSTSIKWAFYLNNQIRLWDNTAGKWVLVQCSSEPTLANTANDMGGTAITYTTVYDIFGKKTSATAMSLHVALWLDANQRDDAWATSTGYEIGHRVNESGSVYACVENHTSGTFAVDVAAGKWIEVDSDGLDRTDGTEVFVNSGAWREYRYLGCVYLLNDSGAKFYWTDYIKYLWNKYNRTKYMVKVSNSEVFWTYATATWRQSYNGTGQSPCYFLLGETQAVTMSMMCDLAMPSGGTYQGYNGLGVDSTSSAYIYKGVNGNNEYWTATVTGIKEIDPGAHYITTLEYVNSAGTITYYGTDPMANVELWL